MKSLKYWTKEGFDVATFKWGIGERVNKTFNGSGSDNSNRNVYTYNELGFRGDSIHKQGFRIMSVGCSHTEGVGVNDNETWPHYFSRLFENGVDLNFGFGGRSNDYIARTIITFVDVIKPDLVNIMYTYPSRKEFYLENGNLEPFHINPWGYFQESSNGREQYESLIQTTNPENDFINWYKNHLLISNFLLNKKIPFIWNGSFLGNQEYQDDYRFDGDYNKFDENSVENKHADKEHNQEYSKKLYDCVVKKYPDLI